MANALSFRKSTFLPWLIVLTMIVGCAGRRITTAVEDQTFQPGPPQATPVETVKATPRLDAETPRPETAQAIPPVEEVRLPELSDIYFDYDQYAIRGEARSILKANAGLVKSRPDQDLVIEGHCDERGTGAYNLVLGERRAQAVKQYLKKLGLASSQIQIISYGKERPVCREHSEACWQSNRRAHFRRP